MSSAINLAIYFDFSVGKKCEFSICSISSS